MGLLRDDKVKTRRDHKCHGCREVIPKGTDVYSQTIADQGTVYTLYTCDDCLKWCGEKKCQECQQNEEAYEGYVKECKSCSA